MPDCPVNLFTGEAVFWIVVGIAAAAFLGAFAAVVIYQEGEGRR